MPVVTKVAGWSPCSPEEYRRATASEVGSTPDAEVRVRTQANVGVYHNDTRVDAIGEGLAVLTSKNIFLTTEAAGTLRLPLSSVKSAKPVARVMFFSSPKLYIKLLHEEDHTKLSFRQGGQPEFLQDLDVMLEKKRWLVAPGPSPGLAALSSSGAAGGRGANNATPPPATVSQPADASRSGSPPPALVVTSPAAGHEPTVITDRAGIRGLVDKRDAAYEVQQTTLRSASRDIDELMTNATQVQAIIRQLKAAARGPDSEADEAALRDLEVRIGVAAPVTKTHSSADEKKWHSELAGELGSWLTRHPILRGRPSIPLTELFALYNRARGATNAVSPSDLLKACNALEQGSFSAVTGASVKKTDSWSVVHEASGVVLLKQIHAKGYALTIVSTLLTPPGGPAAEAELVSSSPLDAAVLRYSMGVRASELAAKMHIGVPEATDMLHSFEEDGVLCRGAPRGLNTEFMRPIFYWNPFLVAAALELPHR
jgi:ESCRT-II complex subunit VPS36